MILPKKSVLNAGCYDIPLYPEEYSMKLDLNENLLGPSSKVLEALKNIQKEDILFYPAYGKLIDKLAEFNNVPEDMILTTNGSDEAINAVLNTFLEEEDSILAVTPTFTMSKVYAQVIGCGYKEVKYQEKWVFPTDEFIKNIDETTKLIIITTPNSPTGESIPQEDLLKIINAAKNSIIMLDETYSSFVEEKFTDLAVEYPNVVIIRSMSKDFALAGLRLGYIISNNQNINYIKRVISPFSVNIIAAKAGVAALDDKEYFKSMVEQVKCSREILFKELEKQAVKVYPSSANFLLADFGEKADFFYKRFLNSGIKVKRFPNDSGLKNCFRIAVPCIERAKLFAKMLEKRELIIFDMDGVLIDVTNSYRMAIKATYEYFAGQSLSSEKIQEAKNLGGLNNDWYLTQFLLEKAGINIHLFDIINKFQDLYYGNNGSGYISNEELLISPEILQDLAKNYDLAIFTGRPRTETDFALKKWHIENLFSMVITMDDVPDGLHKPDPYGVNHILSEIEHTKAYYLGDTIDDIIAAQKAGINGIGILPPQDKTEALKRRLMSEGAVTVLEKTQDIVEFLTGEKNHERK